MGRVAAERGGGVRDRVAVRGKRCRQLDEEERAAAAKPEPDADGIDRSWCRVGERVVFIRVADGQRTSGFDRDDGTTAWLVGGATGVIVEAPAGGYAEHRCPDHSFAPECICGDDETDGARPGYVAASESWAVVEWSAEDGGDPIRRALHASDEGTDWRRRLFEKNRHHLVADYGPGH